MSADRHRGIRREKQKRAKEAKQLRRQQNQPVGAAPSPAKAASPQQAA